MYSRIIYQNKNGLLSSMIVAGWDSKYGAQIYAVSSGGSLIPVENYYGTGSGMAILRGYLEAHYRPNMSYEEARQLLLNGKIELIQQSLCP
jgi:20S proteasome subunit beta 1